MTSPFRITVQPIRVHLDSNRQGKASYTISNASGRKLRGRARLVPDKPEAQGWLTLIGEMERDFPIAGTQQYTVQIEAPSNAPAGSYLFRLDMVGVENPDEDYAEGQSVTFQVPETEPKERPFPWWVFLVGAVALVLIGIAVFLLLPHDVKIPKVAGKSFEEAAMAVEESGLTWIREEESSDQEEGIVIRSSPPAGMKVNRSQVVTLVVSIGYVERALISKVGDGFEPDLAFQWTVSDDGRIWVFVVSDGYRMENGSDFNAFVVRDHLNNSLPAMFNLPREDFYFEILDTYTIRIILPFKYSYFLDALSEIKFVTYLKPRR